MPIPATLKRQLRSRAQLLDPILKLGHAGATDAFIESLRKALADHALVKIRFTDFKEEKKQLAQDIAQRSGAELIQTVGHVAIYYQEKPAPE